MLLQLDFRVSVNASINTLMREGTQCQSISRRSATRFKVRIRRELGLSCVQVRDSLVFNRTSRHRQS
ncbi:unnamed protein product [Peronospora belbahrii]|uniref:Uncharacterized protein n=1 Tax=Peronospora belbahrii TaxID=622444 RepID=A0AAU9L9Y6_9STRA|nr:unnamed protein product [Peronospora belbahrii]CAH0519619.1 unnamed protein product [Peronospora belbahrii]